MNVTNTSDQLQVSWLLSGTNEGLSLLYDKYSGALLGAIMSILRDDEDAANDCLQNTFIKIWKNAHTYEATKGRLFTWMLNIARNTAIDALRKKKSGFGDKIQSIDNNVNIVDSDKNSSIKDDLDAIKQMSKKLNQEQFEVFNAVYFLGYTQDEVAQMLNLPLGTVKTRCRSAIKNIQKLLGHE
jgi:RNA polymerase sigma-70 factor (ECF subfamily)